MERLAVRLSVAGLMLVGGLWYGFWKLPDGLRDCVFLGTNCEYAYGQTPQQELMGLWSDGTPVTPMAASTTTPP